MKKFFLLTVTEMMTTTAVSQNPKETITLMSCVQCDEYFELEIDVDEMVKLVLSYNTVSETDDSFGIRARFYEEFPKEPLPGVTGISLNYQDNFDTLSIIMRKALTDKTLVIYVFKKFRWLQSVNI